MSQSSDETIPAQLFKVSPPLTSSTLSRWSSCSSAVSATFSSTEVSLNGLGRSGSLSGQEKDRDRELAKGGGLCCLVGKFDFCRKEEEDEVCRTFDLLSPAPSFSSSIKYFERRDFCFSGDSGVEESSIFSENKLFETGLSEWSVFLTWLSPPSERGIRTRVVGGGSLPFLNLL